MESRQRPRSSKPKASAPDAGALTSASIDTTQAAKTGRSRSAAVVPGTTAEKFDATEISAEISQVRFVGEQLIYRSREERIAAAAYHFAQDRGFEPGHDMEDWLRAEREVDALLASSGLSAD